MNSADFLFDKTFHDDSRGSLTVEGPELVAAGQALWLPVEHTTAVTISLIAGFADDTGELATTFLHLLWMTFINLITRLHNHHVTPVFLAAVTDVRHAVGNDVVGIQFGMAVHCPVGIERHANHIKLAAILQDGVEVEVIEALIMTSI